MKFNIKTFNTIHPKGLQEFSKDKYTISSDFENNEDAIICRSASLHDISFAPTLKVIARAGIGVNNIPIDRCTEAGVVVFNTPGANANAVKELVGAALLLASRNIVGAVRWTDRITGQAEQDIEALVESGKKQFSGSEIQGKTFGVIGLGAIGGKVANMGLALGMDVVGYDPFLQLDHAHQLSSKVEIVSNLETICERSDYISVHVGYNSSTHHLLHSENLTCCKSNAVLLNFSRAKIVDEEAVKNLLNQEKLGKYISDFPSELTQGHPKIVCLPHLGASTRESEENCAYLAANAVKNFLETGEIRASVNFPNCALNIKSGGCTRLLIGNKYTEEFVSQITQMLESQGIEIDNMINVHRGECAYNIIDVDKKVDESVLSNIAQNSQVLFVRQITI